MQMPIIRPSRNWNCQLPGVRPSKESGRCRRAIERNGIAVSGTIRIKTSGQSQRQVVATVERATWADLLLDTSPPLRGKKISGCWLCVVDIETTYFPGYVV